MRAAQAPATRREGGQAPGRSEMTAASTNRGLRNDGRPRILTNRGFGWGGGATSGHVDAQINFIVSFLLVQWAESS